MLGGGSPSGMVCHSRPAAHPSTQHPAQVQGLEGVSYAAAHWCTDPPHQLCVPCCGESEVPVQVSCACYLLLLIFLLVYLSEWKLLFEK